MIIERIGSLFDQKDLDALAQGVNTAAAMGRGIAAQFRARYPAMYDAYRTWCNHNASPGMVHIWYGPPLIYNLGTQRKPGVAATLRAIERSVRTMCGDAMSEERTADTVFPVRRIGMPRIGTGYGRLPWEDVRAVLEVVAGEYPQIELIVCAREEDR